MRLISVRDLACLAILVPLAPMLLFLSRPRPVISKDGIAYITFARELFSKFSLHLPAWIHVDSGMILPPIFPFLVGMADGLSPGSDGDTILIAKWVCAICLSLASIPLYFLLSSYSNRVVSFFTIGGLHLSLEYFKMSRSALTEASFILVVTVMLFALTRFSERFDPRLGIWLGLLCALTFLTRQIGLIALPFCVGWLTISGWAKGISQRELIGMLTTVTVGFFIIFGSYAGLLYAQTGQHPFRQNFRWNHYAVSNHDPAVLEDIERIQASPEGLYSQIYAKRRLMFQLLPDGAEMYDYLLEQDNDQTDFAAELEGSAATIFRIAQDAASNLKGNLDHLKRNIGVFYYYAFLLATLSIFLPPSRNGSDWYPRTILAFAWMYLFSISLLGDLVARYVVVLVPFVILATVIEFFRVARKFTEYIWLPKLSSIATLLTIMLIGMGTFSMPRVHSGHFPTDVKKLPPWPQLTFRKMLEPGSRVFTMHPLDSYLIGGTWMILPNDSLEKVVEYGRRTHSRWLFVARYDLRARDEKYYTKTGWYRDRNLETHYPSLVKRCQLAETEHYRFDLYRIRPAASVESTGVDECEPVIFQTGVYKSRPH